MNATSSRRTVIKLGWYFIYGNLLPILVFLLFFCGIYRHDTPRQLYTSLAAQPQFDCVGRVLLQRQGASTPAGSCVLIDKFHLLSAAHVLYHRQGGLASAGAPSDFGIEIGGKNYKVRSVVIHSSYVDSVRDYDIAIITLQDSVKDIKPALLNNVYDELHTRVVGVGYGTFGPSIPFDSMKREHQKNAGENQIDSLEGVLINGRPSVLDFSFDSPESGNALPLEYIPNGGDSGGGLFEYKDDNWVLIGVCHGCHYVTNPTTGFYGSIAKWTRVSAFVDWIKVHLIDN